MHTQEVTTEPAPQEGRGALPAANPERATVMSAHSVSGSPGHSALRASAHSVFTTV